MSDQDIKASGANGNSRLDTVAPCQAAIVLVAHGDRGNARQNSALATHVGALESDRSFHFVAGGLLNGEPNLQTALLAAKAAKPERIFVYPLFMAAGYFVEKIIPEELKKAGCGDISIILPPLGRDQGLPPAMLARAVGVAREANLSPATARLLVVGHGSKSGSPASQRATQHFAAQLRGAGVFKEVEVALLEEAPFLPDVLKSSNRPTVVVGYFYGAGLHASEDVPAAIEETGADALYTGSVGRSLETTDLIRKSVNRAITSANSSNAIAGASTVGVSTAPASSQAPKVSFFDRVKCFFSGLFSKRIA
ncbi:MAG: CbiX/SirB N-terminal domain-containing protein [Hyphomicrobiaceae bacterium]